MSVRLRVILVLVVGLLTFYLVTLGWRAVVLISDGGGVAVALGVALLTIVGVGVWAAAAEIRFGVATARLGKLLDGHDGIERGEIPRTPSGRVDRAAADAVFERYRAAAAAAPDDWRAWYRLSLAYDLAGDRRRARGAARTAVRLERGRR